MTATTNSSPRSLTKAKRRWPYRLTPKQTELYESKSRFLVLVAGRRFGKTVFALTWLKERVLEAPAGALGYYVAPFRTMAKAIAWEMLLAATRGIRTGFNISELTVTFRGGRRIVLKGADDPETLEGVGLVACVMDEFGRMKLSAWEKSIRPALSDKRGRALFCGKPRGHNHLKDFYDKGTGATKQPGWTSWLYTTAEGGFVAASDIAEAKRDLPARVYRQEYESTFESLAGRVYDGFTRKTHVRKHADILRDYQRDGRWLFTKTIVAGDWGFTSPGVMLVLGLTAGGRIVIVHERYEAGLLVAEPGWLTIAKDIRTTHGPLASFHMDPSEPDKIKSLRQCLNGSPVVYGAENPIAAGIRKLSIALLPYDGGTEPRLIVSDSCVNTIREFEAYVWREQNGVTTEEPADAQSDHALDSARYGVAALWRPEWDRTMKAAA